MSETRIPDFVRQHVNADGMPKTAYESESYAALSGSRLIAKRGLPGKLYPYQCSLCGKWHLSHKRPDPKVPRPEIPWYGEAQ